MSISDFLSLIGFEFGVVLSNMKDMGLVCLEGSSLSLDFRLLVKFDSSFKFNFHVSGSFFSLGSII